MKKLTITIAIILGLTMTTFADGGLFKRGYNAENGASGYNYFGAKAEGDNAGGHVSAAPAWPRHQPARPVGQRHRPACGPRRRLPRGQTPQRGISSNRTHPKTSENASVIFGSVRLEKK